MGWTAVLALSALLCIAAAMKAFRTPGRGLIRTCAWGLTSGAAWGLGSAVLTMDVPSVDMVTARLLVYAGALGAATSSYWLARTLDDPHRRPSTADRAVLCITPVVILGALVTNPWHQMVYRDDILADGTVVSWAGGPLAPALTLVLTVPAGLSVLHFWRGVRRSPAHFRPHVRTLLACSLVTSAAVLATQAVQLMDPHLDLTPLALGGTAAAFVHGLGRRQMLTVVPLARGQVVEGLPDAVLVTDTGGRVVDVNASCRELLLRLDSARGTGGGQDWAGRALTEVLPFVSVSTGDDAGDYEVVNPLAGLHLHVRNNPVRDDKGVVVGRAFLLRDISEVVERRLAAEWLSQRLAQVAAQDPLTGLLNRRGLHAAAASLQPGAPLGVVILDVDHFKAVNDTYGHDAGDAVLRALAGVLMDVLMPHLPGGAEAARLGGEEFALLLPGMGVAQTRAIAEEALTRLRAVKTPALTKAGELRICVTASAGVAVGTLGSTTELLREADEALYAAKHSGRDQVVVAPGKRSTTST